MLSSHPDSSLWFLLFVLALSVYQVLRIAQSLHPSCPAGATSTPDLQSCGHLLSGDPPLTVLLRLGARTALLKMQAGLCHSSPN